MKKYISNTGYVKLPSGEIAAGKEIYLPDSVVIQEATEEDYNAFLKKQEEEAKKMMSGK